MTHCLLEFGARLWTEFISMKFMLSKKAMLFCQDRSHLSSFVILFGVISGNECWSLDGLVTRTSCSRSTYGGD